VGWRFDGIRVWCDLEGAGVVLSFKDNVRPSPPVRSAFDGIVHGCLLCSLCTSGGRHSGSNGQDGERGVLSICGGEMNVDVATNDLFHDKLGEMKGRGCFSLCKTVSLSMDGWKKWGQKLCSTILRAVMRCVMSAPQQMIRFLKSLQFVHNSFMRSGESGGEIRKLEEK